MLTFAPAAFAMVTVTVQPLCDTDSSDTGVTQEPWQLRLREH